MADTKLLTKFILRNDTFTNWDTVNPVLEKGEVGIAYNLNTDSTDVDYTSIKMKIGDGKTPWKTLPYFGGSETHVLEVTPTAEQTHDQAIAAKATEMGITLAKGDIAIVKETINGDKQQYTAYVYNGESWTAMDGNYNAENVYFSDNITITTAVGNITVSNGAGTIPAAGKNLKQVFEAMYTKEDESLTVNTPAISLTLSSNVTKEVGTEFTRPTGTLKITSVGDYEYGSKDASGTTYTKANGTNVKFSKMRVGFGSTNIDTISSDQYTEISAGNYGVNQTVTYTANETDISEVLVTDGTKSFYFAGEAHHGASDRFPITNLGNYIKDVTISGTTRKGTATTDASEAGGNITASATDGLEKNATFTVTGYRKPFWGYKSVVESLADPTKITSVQVRALGNSGNSASDVPTQLTVPVGTKQVFFAVQKGKKNTLTITDDNALGAGVACTKHTSTINVADARGTVDGVDTNTAEYDLWYVNLDGSFGKEGDLQLAWT